MKTEAIEKVYPYNHLSRYVLESNFITLDMKYEIFEIPARKLIVPQRIDLMAKWIYIDAKEKGIQLGEAELLYKEHIKAFTNGTFIEQGNEKKNSIEKYFSIFNELIDDIRANGFDSSKTLIPIGRDNVLIDGAHRCVCAAYYNKNVTVIKFDNIKRNFDYKFFRSCLLEDKYIQRMANEYCKIIHNVYFACIWPMAFDERLRITAEDLIVEKCGKIIFSKDVFLNYKGIFNFMSQVYGAQEWTGGYERQHEGIKAKADACFKKGKSILAIVFEADNIAKVLEVKNEIRKLFNLKNHSVHISDNADETRIMSDLLFNNNSLSHLCFGYPDYDYNTNKRLEKFKAAINHQYLIEDFIIDTSSVLAVYGIRAAKDLDYLTSLNNISLPELEAIDNHEEQLKYYTVEKKDLLYNPKNYFVYNGLKFVSLENIYNMKKKRGEKKDKADNKLIKRKLLHISLCKARWNVYAIIKKYIEYNLKRKNI